MVHSKSLEHYQRGLEMEAGGIDPREIATRLGYKDAKAWYSLKTRCREQQGKPKSKAATAQERAAALNARAAADAAKNDPKPHPWAEAAKAREPEPAHTDDALSRKLKRSLETAALIEEVSAASPTEQAEQEAQQDAPAKELEDLEPSISIGMEPALMIRVMQLEGKAANYQLTSKAITIRVRGDSMRNYVVVRRNQIALLCAELMELATRCEKGLCG